MRSRPHDVTRDELIVTTKLWNDDQDRVEEAFEESLRRLGLDYIDIYLVHWPWPQRGLYAQAFERVARLKEGGALKAAGVANFYPEVLSEVIAATGVTPVLNQVELHVGFTQPELRDFHSSHGICTEAWAPLARGENFSEPEIGAIADAHGAAAGAGGARAPDAAWLLRDLEDVQPAAPRGEPRRRGCGAERGRDRGVGRDRGREDVGGSADVSRGRRLASAAGVAGDS